MRFVQVTIIACVILLAAQAGIVGWRSLADLESQADLIVVGQMTEGTQTSQVATFTVLVERVVKGGDQFQGRAISITWPAQQSMFPAGLKTLPPFHGLWFLIDSRTGWVLLPVMQGDVSFGQTFVPIPAWALPSAYSYEKSDTTSTKLASEISTAIENASKNDEPFFELLQLTALDTLPSQVFGTLHQRMVNAGSPTKKAMGLAGMLRAGNFSPTVGLLEDDPILQELAGNAIFLSALRNQARSEDASLIAWLGRVANSSNAGLQSLSRGAAYALGSIHTKATLPYLGTLLDSKDPVLRVEAIGGLASFANGLPIQTAPNTPSMAAFQLPAKGPYKTPETMAHFARGEYTILRDEAKYLDFWKRWWTEHRVELSGN